MALIAKFVFPTPVTESGVPQIPNIIAGELLDAGAFVYISASDGKAYNCNATSANAPVAGVVLRTTGPGERAKIYGVGLCLQQYAAAATLVPGALCYLSAATPGGLDTAATTGDAIGVARAVTGTDIQVVRMV